MDRYTRSCRRDYLHSLHHRFLRDSVVANSNQNHWEFVHDNDRIVFYHRSHYQSPIDLVDKRQWAVYWHHDKMNGDWTTVQRPLLTRLVILSLNRMWLAMWQKLVHMVHLALDHLVKWPMMRAVVIHYWFAQWYRQLLVLAMVYMVEFEWLANYQHHWMAAGNISMVWQVDFVLQLVAVALYCWIYKLASWLEVKLLLCLKRLACMLLQVGRALLSALDICHHQLAQNYNEPESMAYSLDNQSRSRGHSDSVYLIYLELITLVLMGLALLIREISYLFVHLILHPMQKETKKKVICC